MTATATPAATVEHALAAAPGMMTVPQLRTKTGLDEKTVRAELRRLAGLGQIEHIPGRGRYDGRYGLTTTAGAQREKPQPEVGKNTGSRASVPSLHCAEGAAVRPDPAPQPAAQPAVAVAEDESGRRVTHNPYTGAPRDPRDIESDPMGLLIIDPRKLVKAASETAAPRTPGATEFSLLGVLADIRAAIGDPTGKIMLGELAEHIRGRVALLEAEPAALRTEIAKADRELDEVRDALADLIGGEIDPSDLSAAEIARAAALVIDRHDDELIEQAKSIIDLGAQLATATAHRDAWLELAGRYSCDTPDELAVLLADTFADRRNQIALVEDLHRENARLQSENIALKTLDDAMPGFGAAFDAQKRGAGYIMSAAKRNPQRIKSADKARAAALAAIRAGAQRAEVFALIPIGHARRGAEWRPA